MTRSGTETRQAATNGRDNSLDVVKGFLVIGMVLYHVGSNSIASVEMRNLAIGVFLSFVSGSWVFAAGYVVGLHYGPRFGTDIRGVTYRLVSRGLKLILLFFLANTLIMWSGFAKSSWTVSVDHLLRVFLHGGGELSSFEILVGIGSLLILSPLLVPGFRRFRIASGAALLAVSVAGSFGYGYTPNLWMLICGAWGIWVGLAVVEGIGKGVEERHGLAYIVPIVMVAGIAAHYGLFLYGGAGRKDLAVYLLGVISINGFVYFLAPYLARVKRLHDGLQLLGRFSLFSYIWQMGIIWTLIYLAGRYGVQPLYARDVAVVIVLLFLSVAFVEVARRRFACVDNLYKAVFA